MRKRYWLLPIILFAMFGVWPDAALGQAGVTFSPTDVSIDFPESITFDSKAVSAGADIVKAQFVYYLDRYGASDSTTRENLDIQPGKETALYYVWDTHDLTIIPWSPIVYHWRVTDAEGNVYESEPERVYDRDTRFDWKEKSDDDVVILWHDKPDIFGEEVFDIAQKAIERERKLFGSQLSIPIRIIVYNSQQEFTDWHSVALDWVGGEAFPDFGVTTQIVTSRLPDPYWLNAVIPHELSHLYLYQTAYNPTAPIPVWLDEGIAQYNEFSEDHSASLVEEVARKGELIPLTSLAAGFGQHDEARIRLSYAEGLSAVKYLVDTYGEAGLARLLAGYKKGLATDDAFRDALGVSMGAFQQDWAESVGASADSMVTPTPWPMPTFPPSPTPMRTGGADKPPTPVTATPAEASPPPSSTSTPAVPVMSSPPPAATTANPDDGAGSSAPPCPGLIVVLPIFLAGVFLYHR